MDFAGRVIVVSGGATGMGRATVELLLERSARVALIDWNRKEAEAAANSANAPDGKVNHGSVRVKYQGSSLAPSCAKPK